MSTGGFLSRINGAPASEILWAYVNEPVRFGKSLEILKEIMASIFRTAPSPVSYRGLASYQPSEGFINAPYQGAHKLIPHPSLARKSSKNTKFTPKGALSISLIISFSLLANTAVASRASASAMT